MDIEKQKVQQAFSQFTMLKNDYNVVISGIGRENTAKAMMNLPEHDLCILLGFGAVIVITSYSIHYTKLYDSYVQFPSS